MIWTWLKNRLTGSGSTRIAQARERSNAALLAWRDALRQGDPIILAIELRIRTESALVNLLRELERGAGAGPGAFAELALAGGQLTAVMRTHAWLDALSSDIAEDGVLGAFSGWVEHVRADGAAAGLAFHDIALFSSARAQAGLSKDSAPFDTARWTDLPAARDRALAGADALGGDMIVDVVRWGYDRAGGTGAGSLAVLFNPAEWSRS